MKYWAYINNEVQGPYEKEELLKLPQFGNSTLLCPQSPVGEKTQDWKEAASFPEISAMISEVSARRIEAPPADSGFGNPFHNFGNIEIKAIDETLSFPSPTPSPSPLDPISLSQIARRQDSVLQKEDQLKNVENKTENKQDEQSSASSLTNSSSSKINEINPEMPTNASNINSEQEVKKDINLDDMPLGKEQNDSFIGSNVNNPLPDIAPIQSVDKNIGGEVISELNIDKNNLSGNANLEISPGIELPKSAEQNIEANKGIDIGFTPEINIAQNDFSTGTIADNPLPDLSSLNSESIPDISQQKSLPAAEKFNTDINEISSSPAVSSLDSDKIISLIEKFASSSASKDDISTLRSYLDSKIEVLNNRINSFDAEGIKQSIQSIENKISSIEGKINSSLNDKPSISPSSIEIQPNYDAMVMDKKEPLPPQTPVEKPMASLEPSKPASSDKKEADNQKKESVPSDKGKVVKLILKTVFGIILFVGILIALSLALRSAGIIDITRYIPFIPPAKKAMNKDMKEDIFKSQPSTSTIPVDVSTMSTKAEGMMSTGKDLSEEVVYFVRNYIKTGGSKSLETLIIENAASQKLNDKAISWKARKMDEDNYMAFAEFPGPKEPVAYIFEVNYKNKTIRPSNNFAAIVMVAEHDNNMPKSLEKVVDAKSKKNTIRNRTVKKTKKQPISSKLKTKQSSKKELNSVEDQKAKNDNKKEEEYIYEYEDEGEQEYLMPGIPKI